MSDTNTEVMRIRLRMIDLIKSFFVSSPDAERLSRWRGTIAAMAKEQISPILDKAVRELNTQLTSKKLEDIQDEYYALFTDPFGENQLNLNASQYFDGRNYGETLISVRDFLSKAQVVKVDSVTDPEDSLPVLFDMLGTLLEMEKDGQNTEAMQQILVKEYLISFLDKLAPEVEKNPSADFYQRCISFIAGYLDLEKGMAG